MKLLLPLFAVVTTTTSVAAFAPTTNKSSTTKSRCRRSHLASSVLDNEKKSVPTKVKDASRKKEAIMSKAIPFLKCPDLLAESDLAGNFGFDPFGFVKSHDDLLTYREAEIKHARLAMLVRARLEKVTVAT